MPQIKDDLGREFVSLPVLSSVLNLSHKQVRRHVRDKRMLSIKRGQRRYILKDDVLREYPSLSNESLDRDIRDNFRDKRDTIGTSTIENDAPDVSNVPNVSFEKELSIYQQDQKTDLVLSKIEQVQSIMTRLEKSIADVGYIQQDTKTLNRKLERVHKRICEIDGQKGHSGHKIFSGVLIVLILSVIGAGIYGIYQFNLLYKETRNNYSSRIASKDKAITSALERRADIVKQYEKEIREKDIASEKAKIKLDQQQQEITQLQETIAVKAQEEESQKNKRKKKSWI